MRLLFGDCAMDVERRELRRAGDVVRVEPQVFDLILHLVENRDHVVSKEALLAAVWHKRVISDSALSTRINAARQALGDNGERQQFIQTIPRRGFRFISDVREMSTPSAKGMTAPAAAADTPGGPSIAVLAFANLSDDREMYIVAVREPAELISSSALIRTVRRP